MSNLKRWDHLQFALSQLNERSPREQNLAAVFEESPEGRDRLELFLAQSPPAWRTYIEPRLPKIREVPVRYIGFLGNINSAGVVTAAARTEDELLDGLIPWFVEKLMTNGGMCPFVLGVRDSVRSAIETRLAALEPTRGEDGSLLAAPLLGVLRGTHGVQNGAAGLPAQATAAQIDPMNPTAIWGGRYVAPGRVAYTAERFVQVADEYQTAVFTAWLESDPEGLKKLRAAGHEPFVFEVMSNGTLRVTGIVPSGPTAPIEFASGEWVEDEPQ
ncbi:hypothetical protein RKE25_22830 (plasmid) [Dyella sp. BiH032]|uniref:hypothetical protein n=1 Tax=Dyella sp. BiH032 TaxID=3075430 RepID=UPI002892A586|nr:hypothetical protein [Dyella sp. BiH032]WNL48371.1 hypothetical protein RKE25_22830 [Dyella sp. BiH032]